MTHIIFNLIWKNPIKNSIKEDHTKEEVLDTEDIHDHWKFGVILVSSLTSAILNRHALENWDTLGTVAKFLVRQFLYLQVAGSSTCGTTFSTRNNLDWVIYSGQLSIFCLSGSIN